MLALSEPLLLYLSRQKQSECVWYFTWQCQSSFSIVQAAELVFCPTSYLSCLPAKLHGCVATFPMITLSISLLPQTEECVGGTQCCGCFSWSTGQSKTWCPIPLCRASLHSNRQKLDTCMKACALLPSSAGQQMMMSEKEAAVKLA